MEEARWEAWVGRTQVARDRVAEFPARALAATLNRTDLLGLRPGDAIPPVWCWLYFLPVATSSEIGADGHPHRGGFLPPVPLDRRMWAGSRMRFHAPLRIGDELERTSTIAKVAEKAGGSGPLVFVTQRHAVTCEGRLLVEEEQDIVFLSIPERFSPPPPTPLPDCEWSEPQAVDPVRLFRFSALTFNGHRIHYDRPYATEVEKYPGLVVHGPLQATLLFDAGTRHAPGREAAGFSFRALRPLFDFDAATVNGRAAGPDATELFTADGEGAIGMRATLDWAPG